MYIRVHYVQIVCVYLYITRMMHPIPAHLHLIQIPLLLCLRALQCVAVCCSVLQYVAVCCSMLQCVTVCYSMLQSIASDSDICIDQCISYSNHSSYIYHFPTPGFSSVMSPKIREIHVANGAASRQEAQLEFVNEEDGIHEHIQTYTHINTHT